MFNRNGKIPIRKKNGGWWFLTRHPTFLLFEGAGDYTCPQIKSMILSNEKKIKIGYAVYLLQQLYKLA